ncbi:MAG TPA: sigma 54-interacting transcriptional regulator [Spirochaetia bacterium]|nr:sigma 54-interacting transcriptional regulator [Spirochaetia bacterium]
MEEGIILENSRMRGVYERARLIARFPTTVLIEGETGTGKEILADWIHRQSPRSNMPFIKINCGSLPESLIESELFGYEQGAFTGANRQGNPGLIELSDKGTLLLDEIGDLPPTMQVKLLRVLQDREVRRVGGSWFRQIDVRIIACTNRSLLKMVESGKFRPDLYYRLNVVRLELPPLREHKSDIVPLLNYFLEQFCKEYSLSKCFSEDVLGLLTSYSFPGNIRELRNLVESFCVSTIEECISVELLPSLVRATSVKECPSLREQLAHVECRIIRDAMLASTSVRAAAKALGISHSTLLRKLDQCNKMHP